MNPKFPVCLFILCVSIMVTGQTKPYTFKFPESQTTINQWIYSGNNSMIYKHGWGIWEMITQQAPVISDGGIVREFETWATPLEMIYQIQHPDKPNTIKQICTLAKPNQQSGSPSTHGNHNAPDTDILVAVAYNQYAQDHAVSNKLFLESTLQNYLKHGYTEIPVFPNNAITIKPVYLVMSKDNLENGYFLMPVWTGPPREPQSYGPSKWNTFVYVDPQNGGEGDGSVATLNPKTPRTPQNTYNLEDFIYRTVTDSDLECLRHTGINENNPLSVGDNVLLVAMHVTTREIKRWTWQSFFWAPNPSKPYFPSSEAIAQERNTNLGAPSHYAMTTAYQMVEPAQPVTGGVSQGKPLHAYNPFLEAGFGTNTFQLFKPILDPSTGKRQTNAFGVQTNCMSCHTHAAFNPMIPYSNNPNNTLRQTPYSANAYYSLDDPIYEGTLRLDFAWSILGNLVLDKSNISSD